MLVHPDAEIELSKIPPREKAAMDTALGKLRAIGPSLGFPHTSNVESARNLREVRPRQWRSPWRGLYRQIGQVFVVEGVGRRPVWTRGPSSGASAWPKTD